jgi:hypothetical protein
MAYRRIGDLALLGLLVISCGCSLVSSRASTYKELVGDFNKAMVSAKSVLLEEHQKLSESRQRTAFENALYLNEKYPVATPDATSGVLAVRSEYAPVLTKFSEVICGNESLLEKQRSALATLSVYNSTLQSINEVPKEDLYALYQSIRNNWSAAPALLPQDVIIDKTATKDCNDEVKNLISLPPGVVSQSPMAIGSEALSLIGDLINLLKMAVIWAGVHTDDYVRGAKLKQYLLDSREVVEQQLKQLNEEDKKANGICAKIDWARPCPQMDASGKRHPITAWDRVTIERKWHSLREPWHIYLAMEGLHDDIKMRTAKGDTGINHELRQYWIKLDQHQAAFTSSVTAYKEIKAVAPAGDIARAMQFAHAKLISVAMDDKVSIEDIVNTMADLAKGLQKIADEGKTSGQKLTAFLKAIK